jgi:hypothetical protein
MSEQHPSEANSEAQLAQRLREACDEFEPENLSPDDLLGAADTIERLVRERDAYNKSYLDLADLLAKVDNSLQSATPDRDVAGIVKQMRERAAMLELEGVQFGDELAYLDEWAAKLESLQSATPRSEPANARAVVERCAEIAENCSGALFTARSIRALAATLPEAPQPATAANVDLHHDFDLERISLALVEAVDAEFARNEVLRVVGAHDKDFRLKTIAAVNQRMLEGWIELVIKPLVAKYDRHIQSLQRIVEREESLRSETPAGGTAKVPEGWKLLKDTTQEERSWSEDSSHENGNYFCSCANCLRVFVGHKRRVFCKVCDSPDGNNSEQGAAG